jgi:hypothetical protein
LDIDKGIGMNIKRTLAAALALLSVLGLVACSGTKITYDAQSGSYTDKKGNEYLRAPSAYEPVSYETDKTFGKMIAGIGEFDLYQIANANEGEWVTTADGDVLYKEGIQLPTLAEFGTSHIYICREGESIHAFANIQKSDEIYAILKAYLEGESIPYPNKVANESLRLRFASDQYPFLYYRLTYLEYASDVIVYTTDADGNEVETNYGKYFIYNRDDGRCVPAGDVVHTYVQ